MSALNWYLWNHRNYILLGARACPNYWMYISEIWLTASCAALEVLWFHSDLSWPGVWTREPALLGWGKKRFVHMLMRTVRTTESQSFHIMLLGDRNWQLYLNVFPRLFPLFFFYLHVFRVKWHDWIIKGLLVRLSSSSGSKGRCSRAAGSKTQWHPPATTSSLWASSSE